MLQYLIIQIDDMSTSYCHYENPKTERNLISIEDLKCGIFYAMKENLMIQYLCPDYQLPQEYKDVMNTIDHNTIVSSKCADVEMMKDADVIVFNDWCGLDTYKFDNDRAYVLQTTKEELFRKYHVLKKLLTEVSRLNVVITDIEYFKDDDIETYSGILKVLSTIIEQEYVNGHAVQFNLLTDRIMLDSMNNCNAGEENITLAPDGKFYVCPAFYLNDENEDFGLGKTKFSIGDLKYGLDIKNPQLYKLSFAPLCSKCDAYQCKRCVWLNRKMTFEVNTPSHQQCIISHVERNTSRDLLENIRKNGNILLKQEIKEINYLDPFYRKPNE